MAIVAYMYTLACGCLGCANWKGMQLPFGKVESPPIWCSRNFAPIQYSRKSVPVRYSRKSKHQTKLRYTFSKHHIKLQCVVYGSPTRFPYGQVGHPCVPINELRVIVVHDTFNLTKVRHVFFYVERTWQIPKAIEDLKRPKTLYVPQLYILRTARRTPVYSGRALSLLENIGSLPPMVGDIRL